jgi:hypothetical protein
MNIKAPVIRFPFYESIVYRLQKLADIIQHNNNLNSISSSLSSTAPHKTSLSFKCNFIEFFPRTPFGAKDKFAVFHYFYEAYSRTPKSMCLFWKMWTQ